MGYVSGLRCNPRGYPQAVFAEPIIFLSLISRVNVDIARTFSEHLFNPARNDPFAVHLHVLSYVRHSPGVVGPAFKVKATKRTVAKAKPKPRRRC
jgi:hypothetical protein